MKWILLILLTVFQNIFCDDQCFHKPCKCCRTSNCNINSTCENGCIDGYWGDSCFYACPVNCVNCEQSSPSVCGKCHDGYYNGFWHDGNSYGPWTDNCINKCNPQCKSCYYYQHCKECTDGYYKTRSIENCTLPCPQRCVSCISELDCTECKPGYYGRNCSHVCSKGCDTITCDKKTGSCNCTSNYMGETCAYCMHNKFGVNCDLDCPENCFVCNQSDSCLYCKQGYEAPLCHQETAQTTSTHAPKSKEENTTLGAAIGAMFGILTVISIVLALVFCWRKRQRRLNKSRKVVQRLERNTFKASTTNNTLDFAQEYQPDIRNISGKIDIEMSVYDEIPAWSVTSDAKIFPGDANSVSSYENDSDYNEPKDKVSFEENTSSGYKVPIDAVETDDENDEKEDDNGSNYSFATDECKKAEHKKNVDENEKKIEEKEKNVDENEKKIHEKEKNVDENEENVSANSCEETNKNIICEGSLKREVLGRDNPAYEIGEAIENDSKKIEEEKASVDSADSTAITKKEKRNRKRKKKKNIKAADDYEKLQKGEEGEHIYAVDSVKRDTCSERETSNSEILGYEKPISFKVKKEVESDYVTQDGSIYEKEKAVKGDIQSNIDDTLKQKQEGSQKNVEDYEELKKVNNNEHDYEDGTIELHDYTNFDNTSQRSSTFGVFSLA